MVQNYQDAMAICKWAGYADWFITLTCNPNWPEIKRAVSKVSLTPADRADIVSRVFKMKVDQFLDDLTKNKVLGEVQACKSPIHYYKMCAT